MKALDDITVSLPEAKRRELAHVVDVIRTGFANAIRHRTQPRFRNGRLLKIILAPSIVAVWVFGLALAWVTGAFVQGWFHLKLLLVLALSGYHGWLAAYAKKLARGERTLSEKTLRLLNEVPGVATILIVVTVIVLRSVLV